MPVDVHSLLQGGDEDLPYEEDVQRNPYLVKNWVRYLVHKSEAPALARNVLYERALKDLPGSYKLWIRYLKERRIQVRGKQLTDSAYESVNTNFERCLMYLHKMPRVWLEYCEFLMDQRKITKTRETFDRALRSVAVTQHDKIWPLYIKFAQQPWVPPQTGVRIFRRFLKFNPLEIEEFIDYLHEREQWNECIENILKIVNGEQSNRAKGRTKQELWLLLCDIVANNAEHLSHRLNIDQVIR